MALVIAGWLATGAILIYQGVYTLFSGRVTLFFARSAQVRAAPGPFSRVAYAFIYLFPGVGAMVILAGALAKSGIARAEEWMLDNFGLLLGSSLLALVGLLHLLGPKKMLRWTIRTHPDLADNSTVVVITRLVGAGLLLIGLIMLSMR